MIQRKSNLWNQKKCGPLRSSENWIVGLKAIGWPEYSHCDWFIFSPLPATRQFSFHWIISFGVMRGIGSKWNSSDFSDTDSGQLMTPFTTAIFTLSMALFRLRL